MHFDTDDDETVKSLLDTFPWNGESRERILRELAAERQGHLRELQEIAQKRKAKEVQKP